MFRLEVSHLQALTVLLPDVLSTLGSHSVYSCGICTSYSLWLQRVATGCV